MNLILDTLDALPRIRLDLLNRATLVENLKVVHAVIVASEPLLQEAIDRSTADLRDFYKQRLSEEREHSQWLKADLASVGAMPDSVNWWAAQVAGMQYYLIRHVSPQALLGYMAALECRPMTMGDVETLEAAHGKSLLRTVRYHAEHDIDHGADLLLFIERHEDLDRQLIIDNATRTTFLLNAALSGINREEYSHAV